MACRRTLLVGLFAAFLGGTATAQNLPAPTLPLSGNETVPCIQGGAYKACTPNEINAIGGSVTSVGLSLPGSVFSISGSPVTSTGTLTGAFVTQSANTVFAGPASGSAAAPTFRAMVGADLPFPGASSLGGVESYAAVSHQWINSISIFGAPSSTQPAASDLSNGVTGSGAVVLASSPSISSPTETTGTYNGAPTIGSASSWRSALGVPSSTLTSAHLFVGNASNVATDTALSGDVSITNSGASTVGSYNGGTTFGTAAHQSTGVSGANLPFLNGANTWSGVQSFASGDLALNGSTSGALTLKCAATCGTNTLTFPGGTTDFSSTGGASQVVKQTSSGGAFTVGQLAASDLSNGTSGSGAILLASGAMSGGSVDNSPVGSTTASTGKFTSVTDTGITGSTQCVQANSSGVLAGSGGPCGLPVYNNGGTLQTSQHMVWGSGTSSGGGFVVTLSGSAVYSSSSSYVCTVTDISQGAATRWFATSGTSFTIGTGGSSDQASYVCVGS